MKLSLARASDSEREVTPLELFFDLVYVFAISQLSRHLYDDLTVRGGIETAILALAVIYAWHMTTWATNWLDPERQAVKALIIALMFCSLLMSVGVTGAFGPRAWLFVGAYLLLQVIRCLFLIVALRGRALSEHFINALVWELAAGALLVAGAFLHGSRRIVLWALAVMIAQTGIATLHWLPWRGRQLEINQSEISGGHLLERFRLFFLIALGETVVTTGTAFTHQPFTVGRLLTLALAFTGSLALWWCYFARVETVGARATRAADDSGDIGLTGTWALTVTVMALVAIAVGDELAVTAPGAGADAGFITVAFGGPLAFLLAQGYFLRHVGGTVPRSRLLGAAVLVVLGALAATFSLVAGLTLATVVLVTVAVSDTLAGGGEREREASD